MGGVPESVLTSSASGQTSTFDRTVARPSGRLESGCQISTAVKRKSVQISVRWPNNTYLRRYLRDRSNSTPRTEEICLEAYLEPGQLLEDEA